MRCIGDFHIHSKYSRATSKYADIENIHKWAQIKGVDIVGTGDFTHPLWLKELKQNLELAESGLFKFKKSDSQIRFILTAEISSIYSKDNKTRKIHNIIFAPSFKIVEEINKQLGKIGNLKSDGRPILGLDAKRLLEIVLNISQHCLFVPAHIWTPWFSLFGSKSGFDSIEECFEDYSKYIYAGETGLSSDPAMNWRWSALDNLTLISNSDAHSPSKIGREANLFQGKKIDYNVIVEAIKAGANINPENDLRLAQTIEFFPQEGKYHFDGHRKCGICLSPEESEKYNNICPVCGKPLTVGVMNRVNQLADRPVGGRPKKTVPFKRLIPLEEIITEALKVKSKTKKVEQYYQSLVREIGSEFKILLEAEREQILQASLPKIAEGVIGARKGKVKLSPGYDGQFGKVSVFGNNETKRNVHSQKTIF